MISNIEYLPKEEARFMKIPSSKAIENWTQNSLGKGLDNAKFQDAYIWQEFRTMAASANKEVVNR